MGDWDWLAHIDPVKVERERFNVPNVGVLRNREGTHLGDLSVQPEGTREVAIIRALTREREREDREMHRAEVRGQLRGQVRHLELQLARERAEHRRQLTWHKKVTTMGHRSGGPFSLEGTA